MWDSWPWILKNRRAKYDAVSIILGEEIHNRTNTHTQTERMALSSVATLYKFSQLITNLCFAYLCFWKLTASIMYAASFGHWGSKNNKLQWAERDGNNFLRCFDISDSNGKSHPLPPRPEVLCQWTRLTHSHHVQKFSVSELGFTDCECVSRSNTTGHFIFH